VRRLWRLGDDLEARLGALRSEARPEFANELMRRHKELRSGRASVRLALALGVTAAFVLVVGAVGGVAYATSVAKGLKAPVSVVRSFTSSSNTAGQNGDSARQHYEGVDVGNGDGDSEDDEYENEEVAICHRTGSDNNPYVLITISQSGLGAHRNHPAKGNPPRNDIIPAPPGGCPH
jgi:hypothetical protein